MYLSITFSIKFCKHTVNSLWCSYLHDGRGSALHRSSTKSMCDRLLRLRLDPVSVSSSIPYCDVDKAFGSLNKPDSIVSLSTMKGDSAILFA